MTASASQPAVMKPRSEYANAAPAATLERRVQDRRPARRLVRPAGPQARASAGSPRVWLSRWRTETERRTPTANVGSHGWMGESSVSAPSSTSVSSTVVVNSLVSGGEVEQGVWAHRDLLLRGQLRARGVRVSQRMPDGHVSHDLAVAEHDRDGPRVCRMRPTRQPGLEHLPDPFLQHRYAVSRLHVNS